MVEQANGTDSHLTPIFEPLLAERQQRLLSITTKDVQHRHGHFHGIVETISDDATHQPHTDYFGISTQPLTGQFVRQRRTLRGDDVWIWPHPFDPLLPGLPAATTPARVQEDYGTSGLEINGLETIIYRPLKRAVLKASFCSAERAGQPAQTAELYLKVLPEHIAVKVYQRHRMLADAGIPVPLPVRIPVDGVVALPASRGTSLAALIKSGRGSVFDPHSIPRMLSQFPPAGLELAERPSWAQRSVEFIDLALVAMPHHTTRILQLGERLESIQPHLQLGPLTVTHGDLYEAHVLVDPQTAVISGLLDVDSVGPGHRVDDLACLLGHTAVLETVDSGYHPHSWNAVLNWFQAFSQWEHGPTLAARSAAVVLSLIPSHQPDLSAQRVGEQRLAIAHRLMDLATGSVGAGGAN